MKYFIYKIVHKYNNNDFYVGSTKDLKQRIMKHKQSCKNPKFKLHLFINENGGFNNFYFYIIDIIECEQGNQLITEDKYITELKPHLNTNNAIQNKEKRKEYIKQYKEKRIEYDKKRYEENKEKIKEQHKKNYEANKEKKKQYNQANKEKIKEYDKQYRQANKEKIKEYKKQYRQRKKQELI